jgi:hypothetical protein
MSVVMNFKPLRTEIYVRLMCCVLLMTRGAYD